MCLTLSVATVYAVGQVNSGHRGRHKSGQSLRMKFGFGAQIVVGLPVVGNVSVLYMVGRGDLHRFHGSSRSRPFMLSRDMPNCSAASSA